MSKNKIDPKNQMKDSLSLIETEKKIEKLIKKKLEDRSRRVKLLQQYLKVIEKSPPLSLEEEKELLKKAIKGNKVAKARLYRHYLKLVVKIAREFAEKHHYSWMKLDLVYAGTRSLKKAIDSFIKVEKRSNFQNTLLRG